MLRALFVTAGRLLVLMFACHAAFAINQNDWINKPEDFKNSYRCINTNAQTGHQTFRYILVTYPEGSSLPCTVDYEKPTEGKPAQVLWQSANTQGYCEDKATGLANKLAGYGWDCHTPQNKPVSDLKTESNTVSFVAPRAISRSKESSSVTSTDNGLDFVGPVISLNGDKATPIKGHPYVLSAIVTDDVGVSKVHLFYQTEGQAYTSLFMDQDNNSDRYAATISKEATAKGSIKYYIMAEDTSGNTVLHGNSISPRALDFVVSASARAVKKAPVKEVPVITTRSFVRDKGDDEQVLWQKAELSHNISDYELYLSKYPYGNYASLAQARLNYLKEKNATESPDTPKPIRNKLQPLW